MTASLVAGSFLSAHFCVDPGGLETPSTIVGILLLAFSEYTAMRAQTTDCMHVQAWQLPDSQLQMQDWDRHPSPTVSTFCPPGLHSLTLVHSLASTAALFAFLNQKGQHFMDY